jgi:hypothetical protein
MRFGPSVRRSFVRDRSAATHHRRSQRIIPSVIITEISFRFSAPTNFRNATDEESAIQIWNRMSYSAFRPVGRSPILGGAASLLILSSSRRAPSLKVSKKNASSFPSRFVSMGKYLAQIQLGIRNVAVTCRTGTNTMARTAHVLAASHASASINPPTPRWPHRPRALASPIAHPHLRCCLPRSRQSRIAAIPPVAPKARIWRPLPAAA